MSPVTHPLISWLSRPDGDHRRDPILVAWRGDGDLGGGEWPLCRSGAVSDKEAQLFNHNQPGFVSIWLTKHWRACRDVLDLLKWRSLDINVFDSNSENVTLPGGLATEGLGGFNSSDVIGCQ